MGTPIELIVGLGNPEPRYLTTRHNAGFWFVDALAMAHGGSFRYERKLQGELAEVVLGEHRLRLLKPSTFMNLSGRSVRATTAYFRIAPERVLVAYDELDLPPGRAKLKFDGGDAGHNGLRSVIEALGPKFWRLRLGIGHPGPGRREAVLGYVLERASAAEEMLILGAVHAGIEALAVLLEHGEQRAQTQLHSFVATPSDAEDD